MEAVVCIFFLILTSVIFLPFIFWNKTKDRDKLFFIMYLITQLN